MTQLWMTAVNLPFARSANVEADLACLFRYISAEIIPQHARTRPMDVCPCTRYHAHVVRMNVSHDMALDRNGFPAKSRHFVVETNYPLLNELLHDHRLYILGDHQCFHVCWDQKEVVSGEGDETQGYVHDVKAMRAHCDNIRSMGLRARHRATDGLPCTAVKFDCLGER